MIHTKWNVLYDNSKKDIEKRAMLSPTSLGLASREDKVTLTLNNENSISLLTTILTEVVLDTVFTEEATNYMQSVGYSDLFISSYMNRNLMNELYLSDWYEVIEDKVERTLEDIFSDNPLTEEHTIDLESFMRFKLHQFRQFVVEFIELCESEIKEQVVALAIDPLIEALKERREEDLDDDGFVIELDLDVFRDEHSIILQHEENEWALENEIDYTVNDLLIKNIYNEDSRLYRDYSELTFFVIVSLVTRVRTITFDRQDAHLASILKQLFERYGIETGVEVYHSDGY